MSTNPIATGETAGHRNLQHALVDNCTDPDCELHHPEVIEDEATRLTAVAHFLLGMRAGAAEVVIAADQSAVEDVIHNRVDEALAPRHPGQDPEVPPQHFGDSTT